MDSLFRSQSVRNTLLQILYVGLLAALVLGAFLTARQNLAAQGLSSGFDFLFKSTGWDVNFSLLPVTAADLYWKYFLVGILNTLFLGFTGLVLATTIGAIVGLARTSSNYLANVLGRTYVDIFRNIPIILQLFFWYALITHLPTPRNAHEAFGFILTNRGLYVPVLHVAWPAALGFLIAIVLAVALPIRIGRKRGRLQLAAVALSLGCAVLFLVLGRSPDLPFLDMPELRGLNIRGGLRIGPEFTALAVAIAIYGGAYIAEIVRGGFKAVGKGQVEAANALGLTNWQVFSRVRLPLALRAMLPILANQYIWLIKATTLGIAVGFTDFFMITAITINHSGQTIESIAILMGGFLAINLTLAAVFNRINKAIALKGNQLRG